MIRSSLVSTRDLPTQIVDEVSSSGRRLVASVQGQLRVHELPAKGTLVIGRGTESDIVFDDPSISRRHASIEVGDAIKVQDLGSANGTMVGGKRLVPNSPASLTPGVVLQLGSILVTLEGDVYELEAPQADETVIKDPVMIEVHRLVRVAAGSNLSVLLLGETGVGKELFARRIHDLSPRANGQLVRVNCAALVESLLEAELFGYERGAFTGAAAAKPGLLEAASGGTLFLDEVGELPLSTQAKLLRVLESGEVTRVGALRPRPVDVRFVAATHRDLPSLVSSGKFREDLFHRLDGVAVRIPPLRERKSEVVALAESFIASSAKAAGTVAPSLSDDAAERLKAHPWRGNVRELRNVIQRSVLFCNGAVLDAKGLQFETLGAVMSAPHASAATMPPAPSSHDEGGADLSPDRQERRVRVLDALERTVWNQTRAAEILGISRRTLQSWLIELNIPRPRAGR